MKKSAGTLFWQVVIVFFLSRGILVVLGILSQFYFPSARAILPIQDLKYHQPQPAILEMWARWDSEWYLLISEKGYASYDSFREYGHGRYLPQDTAKFFPLYPLSIRLLAYLIPNRVLCGILISNVAAVFFLYYFYLLCSRLFDEESALLGSLLYILFPTSFFLSAVYAESLFLAGMIAAFYYLEEKKLLPAALACIVAMLSRPQGVLAIPALLMLVWMRFTDKRVVAASVIFAACALPLCGYFLYVRQVFGSWDWIAQSQAYWRGAFQYPLYALVRFAGSNIALHGQHNSLIDFSMAALNLVVLLVSFRRLPAPYYIYSIIVVLFPLSSTLFSFSRLCLANFPLFLYLGSQIRGRWAFVMEMTFAMFLAFFLAAFAGWYWVG